MKQCSALVMGTKEQCPKLVDDEDHICAAHEAELEMWLEFYSRVDVPQERE